MGQQSIIHTRPDGSVLAEHMPSHLAERIGEERQAGTISALLATVRYNYKESAFLSEAHQQELATLCASDATNETVAVRLVIIQAIPPDSANVAIVDTATLYPGGPQGVERRFRSAWRRSGTELPYIDMSLARAQRLDEVRKERKPKLAKSDVDYLRAQEQGDEAKQAALKDYRQKLRDLPAKEQPSVDAITTPKGLAAWEPTWPLDPVP